VLVLRDVEVDAHQDAFALQVDPIDCKLGHGVPSSALKPRDERSESRG
jgi:hypothetical protein